MHIHRVNAVEILLKIVEQEKYKHLKHFLDFIENENMTFREVKSDLLISLGMHTKHFFRAKKAFGETSFKILEKVHEEYECLLEIIEKLEAETKEQIARGVL